MTRTPARLRGKIRGGSGKRQAILDGARRVFLRQGYHGTRVDQVVAEAGVSKRTLYKYFATKQDLLAALIDQVCSQLIAPLKVEAASDADLADVLRRLALDYLHVITAPSALRLYRTVLAESGRFPEIGQAFHAAGQEASVDALAAFLARRADAGEIEIADPRFAAEQFLVMVSGAPRTRRLLGIGGAPSKAALAAWADGTVTLFLRGCAARLPRASRRRPA